MWESLTPIPKYIKDEVLLNKKKIFDGQPYRLDYLPQTAKLAEQGHTFLGVRSNGVPTMNGLFTFLSGEIPNYKGVSMIRSAYNDMDDFASKFKQFGYYNLVFWPCTFETDKVTNYVFRGRQQTGGAKHLSKFPKWFDEMHNFYPTPEEA